MNPSLDEPDWRNLDSAATAGSETIGSGAAASDAQVIGGVTGVTGAQNGSMAEALDAQNPSGSEESENTKSQTRQS